LTVCKVLGPRSSKLVLIEELEKITKRGPES
jgi:hypothetical protein